MKIWPFKRKQLPIPETFRELIDEYHQERTLAYSSFQKHINSQKRLAEHLGREPMLSDLSDDTIARFFRKRITDGKAIRTAESEIVDMRTLWYYAHKKGYLSTSPGPRPVKIPDPRTKNVQLGCVQDEDVASCDFL